MPVINITTWPTEATKKAELLQEITRVVHTITGAPLDKITVYVQEIEPFNWADAGVIGNDPEFKLKSRRKAYEKQ